MDIYTAYYPKCTDLVEKYHCCPVSIAGKAPNGFAYPEYKKLAPSWSIWKEWHDSTDPYKDYRYQIRYVTEILSNIDVREVVDELNSLRIAYNESRGTNLIDVALICYERPENFCHRHIVGEWLKLKLPEMYAGEHDYERID